MKRSASQAASRPTRRIGLALAGLALAVGVARAENIDPAGDGSQYAWGENVGWLNAEPLGDGGPGIEVGDVGLTGFLWGENIGWVSLSCENTGSCAAVAYGVVNDGAGVLSGFAWGENVGWISFSCISTASCGEAAYGVTIDPATGEFAGFAWGENVGYIRFASDGSNPFRVRTEWRSCIAPVELATLHVSPAGADVEIAWGGVPLATAYDVVRGDLSTLLGTGDYAAATQACSADDLAGTSYVDSVVVPSGEGAWFLVRPVGCAVGSFDSGGGSQAAPRDAGIAASGQGCD